MARLSRPSQALCVALLLSVAAACGSAGSTPNGSSGGGGSSGKSGAAGSDNGEAGTDGDAGESGDEVGGSSAGEAGEEGPGGASQQGPGGASAEGGSDAGDGGEGGAAAGGDQFGGSAGSPEGPVAILSIVPDNAVFSPPAGSSLSAKYKAFLQKDVDAPQDVTSLTQFSIDPSFGSFQGATLTAPAGKLGSATVKATVDGVEALTNVTIVQTPVVLGPGTGADSPGKFGGSVDASAKPQIVYPPNGVLLPPNMNSLEIHFIPAAGQTLFEIAFTSPSVSLTAYTTCTAVGAGCVYKPDATFWKQIANAARGGAPLTYSVRGVAGSSPGAVGKSDARTMQFSSDDMTGGIYYWNSIGAINRYDFGIATQNAETYLNQFEAGAAFCVGCHAVSRNGKRMAIGMDIPAPSNFKVYNIATKTSQGVSGQANFFSFNPDASLLLYSNGVNIGMMNLNSGKSKDPVMTGVAMPDWSEDGQRVVVAKPQSPPFIAAPGVDKGSIQVFTFDPNTGFHSPKTVVPYNGQNNYYPAFSPDNAWIAFNRSPSDRNSFDNASAGDAGAPDGELWAVDAEGKLSAVRLDAATQAGDSWPKWAPQLGTYESGPIMWMTFSSWRGYGLRLNDGQRAQLWMVGFDPKRAAAGQDPSFTAFWLPFQDIGSGNHIAQWVTHVERKPCKSNADCSNTEKCSSAGAGSCIPKLATERRAPP